MTKEDIVDGREVIVETRLTMNQLRTDSMVRVAEVDKDKTIYLLMGIIETLCELYSLAMDEEEERND